MSPSESGAEIGFTWPIRVYYEDTDAGGIVFYANYLKFFERARTEWLRACGVEQDRLAEETGALFIVRSTAVDYRAPARLDDLVKIVSRPERIGRHAACYRKHSGRLCRPGSAASCRHSSTGSRRIATRAEAYCAQRVNGQRLNIVVTGPVNSYRSSNTKHGSARGLPMLPVSPRKASTDLAAGRPLSGRYSEPI